MFIQDNLQKLKEVFDSNFPQTKFFTMFVGAVIAPFVLLAIGGRAPGAVWQLGFVWTLLAIVLLILVSSGIGLVMFNSNSYLKVPPSINSIKPNFR